MRIRHRFHAVAPAQERMDHVALNRPRPDDRDLHDDVVETRRFQARQHRLLRARFHLEDADRIGALQHLVGRLVVDRDRFERERRRGRDNSARRARTRRAAARACPSPSKSILISPRSLRSSLSHCTIVRSRIDAHSIGATFISGSRVIDHPARMDPHVARKAVDAPADLQQQRAELAADRAAQRPASRAPCVALSSTRAEAAARTVCRARARCCCPASKSRRRATDAGKCAGVAAPRRADAFPPAIRSRRTRARSGRLDRARAPAPCPRRESPSACGR